MTFFAGFSKVCEDTEGTESEWLSIVLFRPMTMGALSEEDDEVGELVTDGAGVEDKGVAGCKCSATREPNGVLMDDVQDVSGSSPISSALICESMSESVGLLGCFQKVNLFSWASAWNDWLVFGL